MKHVLTIQLDPADLEAMIQRVANNIFEQRKAELAEQRKLPVRLTCVAAAKVLGVSVRKFHEDFSHLKRRDDCGVWVASEDILTLKISRK